MDKIFHGLPGVFCFVDILIAGKDEREYLQRLLTVFDKMEKMEWKHTNKYFFVDSLEYLGFRIDGKGIHNIIKLG